jgi:hypothetical protein
MVATLYGEGWESMKHMLSTLIEGVLILGVLVCLTPPLQAGIMTWQDLMTGDPIQAGIFNSRTFGGSQVDPEQVLLKPTLRGHEIGLAFLRPYRSPVGRGSRPATFFSFDVVASAGQAVSTSTLALTPCTHRDRSAFVAAGIIDLRARTLRMHARRSPPPHSRAVTLDKYTFVH